VALGLVAAPDFPEKVAMGLASALPELLGGRVDGSVSWNVPVVVDPLTGSGRDAPEILDVCPERLLREGWNLAVCLTDLPVYRGGGLVAAIVAMVAWIIVAHHLWERPDDPEQRRWAALYNGVTVLTVSVAVLCAYAILFVFIFLAAWVFVPGGYVQTTLKHPVGFGEYLTLAWLGTSLATVAGALGASLEDEETVRDASYGYRQRRRHEDDNDPEDSPAKQ
jgi:hypothetical protein